MSKFYLQCGSFQFVTSADCPRAAAIWGIHQYFEQRIDLDSVDWEDAETIDRLDVIRAMLDLDESIVASEIGFARDDAGCFSTTDIVTEWNQLVLAVAKLEKMLVE